MVLLMLQYCGEILAEHLLLSCKKMTDIFLLCATVLLLKYMFAAFECLRSAKFDDITFFFSTHQ